MKAWAGPALPLASQLKEVTAMTAQTTAESEVRDYWVPMSIDNVAQGLGISPTRNSATERPSGATLLAEIMRPLKRCGKPLIQFNLRVALP